MLLQLGKLLAKSYVLLLTVAAGGLLGANISGFFSSIVEFASNAQRAPDPEVNRWWVHGGWIVGAGLFFVGNIGRALRSMRKDMRAMVRVARVRKSSRRKQSRQKADGFSVRFGARTCGILGSFGVGSLIGGFIGLMLGGSFLLLWFSLAYSPFSPAGWASSVSVERMRIDHTSVHKESVMTTKHPVALYAFGGPIVLGAVAGGLFAGIGTAVEKLKNRVGDGEVT
jgi:hypothetical protein